MEHSAQDKRRWPRKKHITGVDYYIITTPHGSGIIKDVSVGGLSMLIDKHLTEGTIVRLRFALPEQDLDMPIEAVGKVVWARKTESGYVTGVQFME
jgi:hypothetical protein